MIFVNFVLRASFFKADKSDAEASDNKLMGFFALLITICLNSAGLICLRKYSVTPDLGLMVLAIGYLPMASGILFFRQAPLAAIASTNSNWKWIGAWACGIAGIYALFFKFPQFLSVSQLIVAQSVTPFLAVVVTGDYFSKNGRKEPLQRLLPLGFLLALAWVKNSSQTGELISFAVVCLAFLVVQTSMRRLAQLKQPFWVLPRFALLSFTLISVFIFCFVMPEQPPKNELFYFGLAAGLVLIVIQGGYLIGIARTPPLLSALIISSSVPIAIFFEWVLSNRKASFLEAGFAIGYVLSVAAQAFLAKKSESEPAKEIEKRAA